MSKSVFIITCLFSFICVIADENSRESTKNRPVVIRVDSPEWQNSVIKEDYVVAIEQEVEVSNNDSFVDIVGFGDAKVKKDDYEVIIQIHIDDKVFVGANFDTTFYRDKEWGPLHCKAGIKLEKGKYKVQLKFKARYIGKKEEYQSNEDVKACFNGRLLKIDISNAKKKTHPLSFIVTVKYPSHHKTILLSENAAIYRKYQKSYGIFKMKFLRPKYMGRCIFTSSNIRKKMEQEDYELLRPIHDALTPSNSKIMYDTGTNSLVIYDTEEVLKKIVKIITKIDVKRP